MNSNDRNAKVDPAARKLKLVVGARTRDDDLKPEGEANEMAGKVEAAIGRTLGSVCDGLTHVGRPLKP